MLLYPQLLSGAVAQFPLTRAYIFSSVTNLQEDSSRYQSGITNPVQVSWTLKYAHLAQSEADALSGFFEATNGRLLLFTFLDPIGNLLSWSEDLSNAVWLKSSYLTVAATESDGFTAMLLGSAGSGTSQISQILQVPSAALVSFGVFARADQPVSLKLSVADTEQTFQLTVAWKQYFLTESGSGNSGTKTITLSLQGGPAQVSRLTVSPQPAPSTYSLTQGTSGVMPQTRFDQDTLSITASAKDDLSCEVRLTTRLT